MFKISPVFLLFKIFLGSFILVLLANDNLFGQNQSYLAATSVYNFSANGNLTGIPAGLVLKIECIGGGGGGGGGYNGGRGGGGGGGAYSVFTYTVPTTLSLNVVVGVGGLGGNGNSTPEDGFNGGLSSVTYSSTILCSAAGGNKGKGGNNSNGAGGAGGSTGVGSIANGGAGAAGRTTTWDWYGGGGGGGAFITAGNNANQQIAGVANGIGGAGGNGGKNLSGIIGLGTNYGGGGGGCGNNSGSVNNGAKGANGYVRITIVPSCSVSAASTSPNLCVSTLMTSITHTTSGVTGITSSSGLPTGVTAAYASNAITISGTPSVSGTFNYTITPTGCATVATGTITVNPSLPASVNISRSPAGAICAGTSVTFTAAPTNGGTTPSYQWRVNGLPVGTNSTTFSSSTLVNSDVVTCVLTSNATPCLTGSPATSNTLTMTVNPTVTTPTLITVSGTEPSCQLTSLGTTDYNSSATVGTLLWSLSSITNTSGTLLATAINSSTGVVTWPAGWSGNVTVNVVSTGCNGPSTAVTRVVTVNPTVTTPTLITVSGTEPSCQLTSSGTTDYNSSATVGTLSWSLSGITNTSGTLLATAINSSTGVVTWPVGWSGSVTVNVVSTGCSGPSTAVTRVVNVNPNLPASVSIAATPGTNVCIGTNVTFTATPTNGGTPSYQWKLDGLNVGTNSSTYSNNALTNTSVVTCVMTSTATCATGSPATSNLISGIVPAAPTSIAGTASAVCQVPAGSGWVRFLDASGKLVVSINPGSNNLGLVTADAYDHGSSVLTQACNTGTNPEWTTAVLGRSWRITPTNNLGASLELPFEDGEMSDLVTASSNTSSNPRDNVISRGDLKMSRYSGASQNGSWSDNCANGGTSLIGGQSGNGTSPAGIATSQYVQFATPGFSEFWLHGNTTASPLPITLTNFGASCDEKGDVALNWSTASEQNASHFVI